MKTKTREKAPDVPKEEPVHLFKSKPQSDVEASPEPKESPLRHCVALLVSIRENVVMNHGPACDALNVVIAELNQQLVKDGEGPEAVAPVKDQRLTPRDPGEHEQRVAESAGLAEPTEGYVGQD